jgi:hypothetical protein
MYRLNVTSDSHDRNMSVAAQPAGSLALQQWAQSAMYGVVHVAHAEVDPGGSLQPTTVGGEGALRSSYTLAKSSNVPTGAHGQQYAVIHRDVGYLITFTSTLDQYASATADFDAIVHSWNWST